MQRPCPLDWEDLNTNCDNFRHQIFERKKKNSFSLLFMNWTCLYLPHQNSRLSSSDSMCKNAFTHHWRTPRNYPFAETEKFRVTFLNEYKGCAENRICDYPSILWKVCTFFFFFVFVNSSFQEEEYSELYSNCPNDSAMIVCLIDSIIASISDVTEYNKK